LAPRNHTTNASLALRAFLDGSRECIVNSSNSNSTSLTCAAPDGLPLSPFDMPNVSVLVDEWPDLAPVLAATSVHYAMPEVVTARGCNREGDSYLLELCNPAGGERVTVKGFSFGRMGEEVLA
jgi:hypothetical protein